MSGYYVVVLEGRIMDRFESGDDADEYIDRHCRMFPETTEPERVFV